MSCARSLSSVHLVHDVRGDDNSNSVALKKGDHGVSTVRISATGRKVATSPEPHSSCRNHPVRVGKKFQRSYSPLTAKMAHEMITQLTSENLLERHRRHSEDTRRGYSGTFVPSLQELSTPSMDSTNDLSAAQEKVRNVQHMRLRRAYSIGEKIRSDDSHMVIEPTSEQAIKTVNSLEKHDFAFVKRRDGSFTYAILVERTFQLTDGANVGDGATTEECMIFAIDSIGSTKMVRRRHWSEFVHLEGRGMGHLISTDTTGLEPQCLSVTAKELCQEIENILERDWTVPCMISFIPSASESDRDEECSLISNVSDRVRMQPVVFHRKTYYC